MTTRPSTDERTATHVERVLAVGRALLTVTALIAIFLDPTEPARFAAVTYGVLVAYALYSIAVAAAVYRAARLRRWYVYALHLLDVLWASVLTFVSQGPISPFFLFFLFVVLAGAYRWGFRETVATAGLTVVVFLVETAIATAGPWHQTWFASIQFELNATIFRVAYLLLTGCLLGYFAEQEKRSRSEVAAMADAAQQLRLDLGLDGAVRSVADELIEIFGAARVDCVMQECQPSGGSLWQVSSGAGIVRIERVDLSAEQQEQWLFPDPGKAWHGARQGGGTKWKTAATSPSSWPVIWQTISVPPAVASDAHTITAVNIGHSDGWRGRLYLIDASRMTGVERSLHFLEALSEYVTPGLTNALLLRRLRSQVTAAERARVARELHDGAIQALYGLRLRMQAVRRRSDRDSPEYDRELEEMQELLQQEALTLRELMHALRPIDLDSSGQLPDVLATVVERFRRDTGLAARFVSAGGPIVLHPDTALELVRIVQEALVNVRKHSRARNVLVRLAREEHGCVLVIEDDGVGFTFEGRLCAEDLERERVGPIVIKERARIVGARLAVDSTPGSGTRIELAFADATHA